jgi:gliding motility-associated-like protein
MTEPIMKGASVGLDGRLTYSWAPPIDSAFTFNRYASKASTPNDGNQPSFWSDVRPNVTNYQKERFEPGYQIFTGGATPNILQKRPGIDWYFRMKTESGCSGNVASQASEPVQVIEVATTAVGQSPSPARSRVRLDWNRPKPMFSNTYPYYVYESPTHFYIWENDSIDVGGQYLGGEAVASNWYLRGDTSATTYALNTNTCNGRVGFRIEARDTVIIWEQGSAMKPGDERDTLTYRTFSIIDTIYMVDRGFIPAPRLDTIMVKENGDIYYRIDRANAGTAGYFRIYEGATTNPAFANFKSEVDSFLYNGFNGNNAVGDFVIEAEDECNPNILAESGVYSTILPSGLLLPPLCSLNYELSWNIPTGFTTPISRFQIYVDSANTGFKLEKSVNNATATSTVFKVNKGVVYRFRVVAVDQRGAVNMSAIVNYTSPTNLRSFEIVPAPTLVCSYVEDNGNVTLNFLEPTDTTINGIEYSFQYREAGGNWLDFAGSNAVVYGQDKEVTITGIDALANEYEFRAYTISGCDGTIPSAAGNVLKSIHVDAIADPNDKDKTVVLSWNETGAPSDTTYSESDYTVYKAIGVTGTSPYFMADSFGITPDAGLIDYSNGNICDTVNGYYVTNKFFKNSQKYCVSRSAYDTERVYDAHAPNTQLIDFVTVNPQTEELEIYWSNKADEDIDSINFMIPNPNIQNNWIIIAAASWYANPQRVTIPLNVLDVRDTSIWIVAQAIDGCRNMDTDFDNFDYHKNMDVDVEWNQCDSTLEVNWTGYYYFNEGGDEVTYTVYVDSTAGGGTFREIASSETTDSSYSHKVYAGDMNYRFYVKAVNSDASLAANSNIDSDSAFYQDEPLYGYAHYATVTPNKAVELQMLKDTTIRQGGYSIFRGTQKDIRSMQQVGRVNGDDVFDKSTFKYTDFSAETDVRSYFYKIITENQCGGNVDTSNFASSIFLAVYADNEALTNTLKWNEYTDWDSTVAYYNIYRGFNGGDPDELIAVVAPTDERINVYVDDVYDNTNVKGRYCYKVEAVQGPINDEFNGLIGSATSVSNEGCTTQKPLFYVPNAFAPDGVNKMFYPKGQFFDFSLYEMAIYNRWGEQIFITRDVNEGWDGTQNGEIVPLGSYVYTIRFVDADGKEHKRKGTVTVIR